MINSHTSKHILCAIFLSYAMQDALALEKPVPPPPPPKPDFVDGLCKSRTAFHACLEQYGVCNEFYNLPLDVQSVLSGAVEESFTRYKGSLSGIKAQYPPSIWSDFRMYLVQQYWGDQKIAQSIIFLPEKIVDAAIKCEVKKEKRSD